MVLQNLRPLGNWVAALSMLNALIVQSFCRYAQSNQRPSLGPVLKRDEYFSLTSLSRPSSFSLFFLAFLGLGIISPTSSTKLAKCASPDLADACAFLAAEPRREYHGHVSIFTSVTCQHLYLSSLACICIHTSVRAVPSTARPVNAFCCSTGV